jgi:uncharacterized membrane protein
MLAVATLGHALGFSLAAGVNLYATVAILGLASRFGWVDLRSSFAVFDNNVVIAVALALYAVEFVADKIPWVDSAWDAVHTLIRPVGGAFIAVASLGEATPMTEGLMALLGGAVAAGAHLTKAGTRAVVNTSPEPVSNWTLSLAEDVFVIGLGILTLSFPVAAFGVAGVLIVLILLFLGVISRAAWRRLAPGRPQPVS